MRARGLTLVELLVAIFLATLLIGAIASTSMQVQETINTTLQRELAAQQARALFRDIESDLGRLIPCASAPAPFDQDVRTSGSPQRPIELERVPVAALQGDPYPVQEPRCADRLRLYTALDGPTGPVRQVVEYMLDEQGTGGTPAFQPPAGSGYLAGRLRRKVWKSDALPGLTPPDRGPIRVEGVVSFRLDWTDAKADSARDEFLDPTPTTSDGTEFVREGQLAIESFMVSGIDPAGIAVLSAVPVGGDLRILDPANPKDAGTIVLVRHRNGSGANVTSVLVNERLETHASAKGWAFLPPSLVRVTLVLSWGKGQKAETGRFVRSFPVPR